MEQRTDLTNERFGHLVALYPMAYLKNGRHRTIWHCICDCGKEKDIREYSLVHNSVKSCGCGNIVERSIRNSLKNNQMCPACLKKLKTRQAEAVRARIQGIAEIALNNIKDGSLTKANKSGIRGVHWNGSKQRWIATGRKDGKPIDLGRFENLVDARAAREEFVRKEYGSSAFEKGQMFGFGFDVGDCYLPGV